MIRRLALHIMFARWSFAARWHLSTLRFYVNVVFGL